MITYILDNASVKQLDAARGFTCDHLHVPEEDVTSLIAIAYICKHFEQGQLSGWDGFVELIKEG